MTESEYRAIPALSFSSMKDLAVSPYRFWYLHVNPNRPKIEPTKEQAFGQALHCAVLQPPDVWDDQYACELDKDKIPDLLVTIGDMREWLTDKGYKPKGTKKEEVIAQVQACDPNWPIWEVLETQHYSRNVGKTMISCADFDRIAGCTEALKSEPRLQSVLETGQPEVELFWDDCDTGQPCKCRLDWLAPDFILDLKTFQQKARKSIDESVADAIWWEGYLRQGFFYTEGELLNRLTLQGGGTAVKKPVLFAFVESELPHEVRLRRFQFGDSLYYKQTELEVRRLIELYAECKLTYGEWPWRDAQEIVELQDEQFRQLGWT